MMPANLQNRRHKDNNLTQLGGTDSPRSSLLMDYSKDRAIIAGRSTAIRLPNMNTCSLDDDDNDQRDDDATYCKNSQNGKKDTLGPLLSKERKPVQFCIRRASTTESPVSVAKSVVDSLEQVKDDLTSFDFRQHNTSITVAGSTRRVNAMPALQANNQEGGQPDAREALHKQLEAMTSPRRPSAMHLDHRGLPRRIASEYQSSTQAQTPPRHPRSKRRVKSMNEKTIRANATASPFITGSRIRRHTHSADKPLPTCMLTSDTTTTIMSTCLEEMMRKHNESLTKLRMNRPIDFQKGMNQPIDFSTKKPTTEDVLLLDSLQRLQAN